MAFMMAFREARSWACHICVKQLLQSPGLSGMENMENIDRALEFLIHSTRLGPKGLYDQRFF